MGPMPRWRERITSFFVGGSAPETSVRRRPATVHGSPEPGVKVVTTALALKPEARARLSAQLGPGYLVVDMKDALDTVDLVIAPAVSHQLIGILKRAFPTARVMLCELQDFELGIAHRGPVQTALDAGADSYCVASSISELASFIADEDSPALEGRHAWRALPHPPAATVDDLVLRELRAARPDLA
jgi:hypothetical protein